jgi:DNA-binding NarL/FixJ family response regulator
LPELDRCIAECLKARELPLRVLLVDDHALVRHTLALLLRQEPDVEVVGEAANGLHGLDLTRQLRPDVVLMDIRMPELDGIQATRAIHATFPDTDVIGLSMSDKIEQAQPMLDAGAAGYVCKSDAPEVLLAAIRACRRAAPAYVAP